MNYVPYNQYQFDAPLVSRKKSKDLDCNSSKNTPFLPSKILFPKLMTLQFGPIIW